MTINKQLSFNEHFIELRQCLIKVVISFMLFFIISYHWAEQTYFFLLAPLLHIENHHHKIIYTSLTEAFFTYIKIAFYQSIVLNLPILFYQIYKFISPGLYKSEKRIFVILLVLGILLFISGMLFCYYLIMPNAWKFFLSFEHSHHAIITLEAKMNEYLSLSLHILMAFGISFELPLILMLCNKLNFITYDTLKKRRRIAIVVIFFIAAIITPPDIISQIGLALPMILLYEIGLILCNLENKRKKNNNA